MPQDYSALKMTDFAEVQNVLLMDILKPMKVAMQFKSAKRLILIGLNEAGMDLKPERQLEQAL